MCHQVFSLPLQHWVPMQMVYLLVGWVALVGFQFDLFLNKFSVYHLAFWWLLLKEEAGSIKTWEPRIRQSPGAPLSWNGSRSSVFSVCSLCSVDGISPPPTPPPFSFTSSNPLVLAFGCFFSMLLLHPHPCWWLQAAIICFFYYYFLISDIPWVYSEHIPSKIERQWPLDTTCTFLCQMKLPPLLFSAACFCFSNILKRNIGYCCY